MDAAQFIVICNGILLLLYDVLAQEPPDILFGKSYNFTCKFSRDMLLLLSFAASTSEIRTTLYTAARQHKHFWHLFDYANRTVADEIHHIFTIRNVTTDRLGTYYCYDNRNGTPVHTMEVLNARNVDQLTPARGNEGYEVTAETTTDPVLQVSSVALVVSVLVAILIIVIVIVIALWIHRMRNMKIRKPKKYDEAIRISNLLPTNGSTRTTPLVQNETKKSLNDTGDDSLKVVQVSPLTPGVVHDTKESRTVNANCQHGQQAHEYSGTDKDQLPMFDINSKLADDVGCV